MALAARLAALLATAIVTASAAQSSAAADVWAEAERVLGLERIEPPGARPELRFADAEGRALDLEAFAGRVVLLNLWATWCAPCIREMPALDRLEGKLGGADFTVVAVSLDRELGLVDEFFAETGIRHLVRYIDPRRRAHVALGAESLPYTLLLDRQGRVRGRVIGPAEWDEPAAEALIRSLTGAPLQDTAGPWWAWAAAGLALGAMLAAAVRLWRSQRVGTGVSPE